MGLPVTLHVYDLGRGQLKAVGTHWAGAFHSAVEVNDREWSFGATDQGSGVFSNAPRGCTMHTYKESIPMGDTALDVGAIDELLADLSREWAGSSYDLLHKNCCHFADALCVALGVGGTPPWLNRAAHAGAGLLDGAESLKNSLHQLNPVVVETGEAVETALGRLDSRFRVSERMLSIETQAVDRMSAFNQKLVQHPAFAQACRMSFDRVVVDGDAGISPLGTELAVWMMYAKLNSILPVHLEAPPRDEILAMFGAVDTDGNGFLARDEFRHFCTMLFSDDTKPHAISLVRVSREVITNLLMLPAACQIVSHYTAVVPLINRVPTVFLAPAITVRRHAIIIQLYKHLRAVHDSKAGVSAARNAPQAQQHLYVGTFAITGVVLVLATYLFGTSPEVCKTCKQRIP